MAATSSAATSKDESTRQSRLARLPPLLQQQIHGFSTRCKHSGPAQQAAAGQPTCQMSCRFTRRVISCKAVGDPVHSNVSRDATETKGMVGRRSGWPKGVPAAAQLCHAHRPLLPHSAPRLDQHGRQPLVPQLLVHTQEVDFHLEGRVGRAALRVDASRCTGMAACMHSGRNGTAACMHSQSGGARHHSHPSACMRLSPQVAQACTSTHRLESTADDVHRLPPSTPPTHRFEGAAVDTHGGGDAADEGHQLACAANAHAAVPHRLEAGRLQVRRSGAAGADGWKRGMAAAVPLHSHNRWAGGGGSSKRVHNNSTAARGTARLAPHHNSSSSAGDQPAPAGPSAGTPCCRQTGTCCRRPVGQQQRFQSLTAGCAASTQRRLRSRTHRCTISQNICAPTST